MNLFWEANQQYRISQAQNEAQRARTDARRQAERVRVELEARCDKALLVCQAMWTILQDKLGVTDEELIERVRQIDLMDGKLDGRIAQSSKTCPACNRENAPRHANCIYCGEPLETTPFAT